MAELTTCPDCDRFRGNFEGACDASGLFRPRECLNLTIARLRAKVAELERELGLIKARRFPVLDGGMTVPWQMLVPHEPQAKANHGQTLERLASRGGLGWSEMLAVLEGKGLRFIRETTDDIAKPQVLARVSEFEKLGILKEGETKP